MTEALLEIDETKIRAQLEREPTSLNESEWIELHHAFEAISHKSRQLGVDKMTNSDLQLACALATILRRKNTGPRGSGKKALKKVPTLDEL